jgi:hypothetical protein
MMWYIDDVVRTAEKVLVEQNMPESFLRFYLSKNL